MQPNWSATTALARAMVVLFAATFVGALVLPLTAAGTLPLDWAHWRTVLATAFAAAVVAELAYARAHLAQVAQAMGLTPAAVAGAAAKAATAIMLFILAGALTACDQTPAQTANEVGIGGQAIDCVLTTGATDLLAGKDWPTTLADVVVQCGKYGVSEGQAAGLLRSHRAAEIKEGFVPKPIPGSP